MNFDFFRKWLMDKAINMIVIIMLLALTFYEYMPKTALSVLNKYTSNLL